MNNEMAKTYNSGYSLVVTDPTTNPPIWSLCMAERTGCPVLFSLWSYVLKLWLNENIKQQISISCTRLHATLPGHLLLGVSRSRNATTFPLCCQQIFVDITSLL
jgi:hypothetical protein